ncbi:helix-turn-helix domain-containing protein [Chimaeribacter arupi]|uniref:Helix-turn-helix domain-containing protein n=2 Tax=Yersiniaceae TaxID=1903411 RepID=A0A2N5EIU3_9GAMM|nr:MULTISPECIES: helix-turn-helix domain-containing protein [Yersiniaceae]MBS0967638.1 helix-turn-helix domain-containing protein [Nissabacter archeti]MDV5140899.1 helix-turn-helix domain-containing protein [Chimaeribacter arupi]PLR32133.1 helix-turn-helix domain-containing protein [Chimaeribacter arupi]PLR42223.1 helix-turn-helix domain-containing protein [Chimaeribacter arupi]PLR45171.1 helix-turn-helix domain-containing protein [Chimaeribacter arupi]
MKSLNRSDHALAVRLDELLRMKGISKAEMARIAGVSPQSVNGWYRRGQISKTSALRLCATLSVPLPWLLGEEVEPESGLTSRQQRMLDLFDQLPDLEQENMLAVFEQRLKELDALTESYLLRRKRDT